MIDFKSLILIVFLFSLLFSCTSPEMDTICTDILLAYDMTVLTQQEEPIDSLQINIRFGKTGKVYNPCNPVYDYKCNRETSNGTYIILHDGFSEKVGDEPEKVIVEGTKGSISFIQEHMFRNDGCHIRKVAGPDTIYIQPD